MLLRLGDVAERFSCQAEVVPRLVGPGSSAVARRKAGWPLPCVCPAGNRSGRDRTEPPRRWARAPPRASTSLLPQGRGEGVQGLGLAPSGPARSRVLIGMLVERGDRVGGVPREQLRLGEREQQWRLGPHSVTARAKSARPDRTAVLRTPARAQRLRPPGSPGPRPGPAMRTHRLTASECQRAATVGSAARLMPTPKMRPKFGLSTSVSGPPRPDRLSTLMKIDAELEVALAAGSETLEQAEVLGYRTPGHAHPVAPARCRSPAGTPCAE